jgi:hypothetical protein
MPGNGRSPIQEFSQMTLGIRRWLLLGVLAGLLCAVMERARAADPVPGQLTEEQLGQMITAIGLKPNKIQQRYDFAFTANVDEEEWQLSMSSVLSQDGKWLWVMAWLDELPKTSAEVPRTALLRLLAENDRLGNGKFFAYIPANRRFVLQVSIPNEDMTSAKLQETMKDLGSAVVETYPIWSVTGWSQPATGDGATTETATPAAAAGPAPATTTR